MFLGAKAIGVRRGCWRVGAGPTQLYLLKSIDDDSSGLQDVGSFLDARVVGKSTAVEWRCCVPHNNFGEIAKTWMFASSSGSGMYETILYTSGASSCNCMGWTRRVDKKGQRSCKHTRMVEQGVADGAAESCKNYTASDTSVSKAAVKLLGVDKSKPVQKLKDNNNTPSGRPKSRFLPNDTSGDEDLVDVERFRKM